MTSPAIRFIAPAPQPDRAPCFLVLGPGTAHPQRFLFYDQIEIGRDDGRSAIGTVLIADPAVSRRHCVVSRRADGRCFIRDLSRNGTRVDERRLVPNVEVELRPGQTIAVTQAIDLVLSSEPPQPASIEEEEESATVTAMPKVGFATLLVGDLCDYTVLVRRAPSAVLQQSVNRVFEILGDMVTTLGGTVKEFQGDALVAFWEGNAAGQQVPAACRAALELNRKVRDLASDRSVWQVEDFALEMDWALATGSVMISAFGGNQIAGLSMIGEPVVLAFRLEKFASAELGRILACPVTRQKAGPQFVFRDLGDMMAKGFDKPDRVFALERELPDRPTQTFVG